jgi:hypothetical protein
MMKQVLSCVLMFIVLKVQAQPDRWQQRISYKIDASLDVVTNKLTGVEQLQYFNNSPDTLSRVFFHTYWNAFQPNSSMDVRSRELGAILIGKDTKGNDVYDRYKKVYDRISKLTPSEVGYQKVQFVKLNGRAQKLVEHETILEVVLDKPILPKSSVTFNLSFEAQVPKLIRRSGRDSEEGIKFSMGQWYPKMVEYDYRGWNANQYVGFEFYGVWGDYDVRISLDKSYMVAATGTLQNATEVGYGYEAPGAKVIPAKGNNLTWHFVAPNVHDFAWAADPTYNKITRQIVGGPLIHVVHKAVDSTKEAWQKVADTALMAYPLMAKLFGQYPYKNFSIIQGGDGGMEYPMATLMRTPSASTAIHEWLHSWFQGMLGSNESLYPWMDEGFTNYATSRIMHSLKKEEGFAQASNYASYLNLVKGGWEEPAATPADHFTTNYASAAAAYHKGATFLSQLGYIIGDKTLDQVFLDYYKTWRFKHPNPNDFIRVAEKRSNMSLQWYKYYWINTTKTVDYAIDSLWEEGGNTKIRLRRVHEIPMPIDVQLTFKDGSKELHYIPLNLMYGTKPVEDSTVKRTTHEEWKWTHPTYTFETSKKLLDLTEVNIDPSLRMADVDRKNNVLKIQW